jgi:RNA polymerase sigma-70 factor (ECF subfamily)
MNPRESLAAQLFLANHGFVKGLALKHAPWPGLADDIVQQVFLEFAAKEKQWDLDSDVKPLLATMTRFVALRYWRERTHQLPEVVQQLAEHVRQLAEERHGEPRYDDELDALRRCLEKLPSKSRAFVDLYYFAENSTAEIATQMNMKSDTVCRALCRLREKLRGCLERVLIGGLPHV